ncbi:MAG TPA: Ig-like domain-containing protein [Gemmatimonadales bacterium]|nr:Ig-like domain-containing protein [Gemmatimonadales bacterium]
MRALLAKMAILLIPATAGLGCGGNGEPGPEPEPDPVLTTVQVTPATVGLFTVAPGNSVTLAVVGRDQNGQNMSGLGPATFSSGNEAVATVSAGGVVTAVGAGTAVITASLTAGAVTETGTMSATVQVAPSTTTVTAPAFQYQPTVADVSAGGTVTWTMSAIPHTVTFTSAGAPASVPETQNASAERTFPGSGSFSYRCTIHPEMTGTVRVH